MSSDDLANIFNYTDELPFLFVGSGISRRYLDLPDWKGLLKEIAILINQDQYYFLSLEQKANSKVNISENYNGYMTTLCDLIANDLNNIWYTDERFKDHRTTYMSEIKANQTSPLQIELTEFIKKKQLNSYLLPNEINSLKKITENSISGLITTNYDTFLEDIFGFKPYCSQEELLFQTSYSVAEIYKIHGSIDSPSTIRITSQDYSEIKDKNKYIAAKLLTIFVEHPIFFLGYSLNDADIKDILNNIVEMLNESQIETLHHRLFFVTLDNTISTTGYEVSSHSISFDKKSLTMTKISLSNFAILFDAIATHRSELPVKTLRQLKSKMYNLALTTDDNSKILVQDANRIISDDTFEIIAGFGILELAKRGYKSIQASEIYRDIILNDGNFNKEYLVINTIPDLMKRTVNSIPFYKYIDDMDSEKIPERITNHIANTVDYFLSSMLVKQKEKNCKKSEKSGLPKTIDGILKLQLSESTKLKLIAELDPDTIPLDELHQFLISFLNENIGILEQPIKDDTYSAYRSDFKRLIKIYDWLKYK